MPTISASDAGQTLSAQLDRVEAGEEIAIMRHGKVVAVLVRPDALRSRRAPEAFDRAERITERLRKARAAPLVRSAIDLSRAEELIKDVRASRSER